MQNQWMIYTKKADFNALAERYGISPIIARIMINRDVPENSFDAYLHGTFADLHDPHLLKDADKAADIILKAIKNGSSIRIVGDYDIDGISSTYLLYTALTRLAANAVSRETTDTADNTGSADPAAATVSYAIPDRIKDGYGINENIITKARDDGVDLILTCDNGIAAASAISLAKEFGMTVIVTDHHQIPVDENGAELLPPADAIINPNLNGDLYPFKSICGGMVAYKLIYILYEKAGIPLSEWEELIDFAALATVGDIMPLKDENRTVVKLGLKSMAVRRNLGLSKLIDLSNLDASALTAYHIGFIIGPCLNASGRLETADLALSLLLTEDPIEATVLAEKLKALNDNRKNMTVEFAKIAEDEVNRNYADDAVKLIYLPKCHESIAGIIAGRIREAFNHPAIVVTDSGDGMLKGSARSIPAYNIFEKLTEVSDLLEKFGGHRMAAGISLKPENLDELRKRLNANAGLSEDDFIEQQWIDVALPFEYITMDLINQLELLEPFGQGNEKPAFAQRNVTIVNARVLGRNHNLVKLRLRSETGGYIDGLYFTDGDEWIKSLDGKSKIDILYYPQVNDYNGITTIQIVIKGVKS